MSADIDTVVQVWKEFLATVDDWHTLTKNVTPKKSGCGMVYELENPIDRPNESFAIADMRDLEETDTHYHASNEHEIYFVLQGEGVTNLGSENIALKSGIVVVIPPNTPHHTVPAKDLVLAVVNTPPFDPANYILVS